MNIPLSVNQTELLDVSCISLLGSQLAPEDIIGVPQIVEGKSVFCPPRIIARDEPYCLFLDELNACSQEVQKAFYSLIHDRRIGEYFLPEGSIIIGAGNRAQDNAIVKPMSSALINRMFHVELIASHRDWLEWAGRNGIHPHIIEYIGLRPDHLWKQPLRPFCHYQWRTEMAQQTGRQGCLVFSRPEL
ncbi:MAG: AAA family ATPase [Clostridiales bacterium]|nr:AAA family ATPase [Clostridiales bacterium]